MQTQKQRENGPVLTEAEIRSLNLLAKDIDDCHQPPGAKREVWNRFSLGAPGNEQILMAS